MEQSSADPESPETQLASAKITSITERIINTAGVIASGNNGPTDASASDPTKGTTGMIVAIAASLQLSEDDGH